MSRVRRLRACLAGAVLLAAGVVFGVGYAPAAETLQMSVRVTHYYATGSVMYSGRYPYPGAAGCSWNMPLGTVVRFRDGRTVTCEDRGQIGSNGWVDIYADSWEEGERIRASYQYWYCCEIVDLLRWGW